MTSTLVSTLPSWREGATRTAITSFVEDVTTPGPGFVPPASRVATFDNDGTLWCEKPLYVQADFIFRRWREMADRDPSLRQKQPYKAVIEGDEAWLGAIAEHLPEITKAIAESCSNITSDAFERDVEAFFAEARHPKFGAPYTDLAYQPMVELLDMLRDNDFSVFICTGGGRDFVRAVSEEVYHVPRQAVIGSSGKVEMRDGVPFRLPEIEQPVDDGPGKPVHIWARAGRMPLFAAGNADGDVEMLSAARFSLLLHHDDEAREFAYDRGSERALAEAAAHHWTVASMKRDFATIF